MESRRAPLVGVIMGSRSDSEVMAAASEVLDDLDLPHEVRILSAHRTPDRALSYASRARSRGLKVIIAGAGGAAHLAGLTAAKTIIPVIGVPLGSAALAGMDSLLATVQMPAGVPVATMAIGRAGAVNGALMAAEIIALEDRTLAARILRWRSRRARESRRPRERQVGGSRGPDGAP